jgi:RNA polymerase sigma-70 factor (ECF subfamily)
MNSSCIGFNEANAVVSGFTEQYDKHYSLMYRVAFKLCGRSEEAEDIAQEAFIKAFRGASKFRGQSKLTTWLHRITVNTAWDLLRRKKRQRALLEEAKSREGFRLLGSQNAQEQHTLLHAFIDELPQAEAEAIRLSYFHGYSHKEIAKSVGCAESTISWRIHMARKSLLAKFQANELESRLANGL